MKCIPFSVIHIDIEVEFVERSVDKLAVELDKQLVDMCRRCRRCCHFDSQVDSKRFDPADKFDDLADMFADHVDRFVGPVDMIAGKVTDTMADSALEAVLEAALEVDMSLGVDIGLEGADKLAVVVEGSSAECILFADVIVAVAGIAAVVHKLVENRTDKSDIVGRVDQVLKAAYNFFAEMMVLEPIGLMTPVVEPAMEIAEH